MTASFLCGEGAVHQQNKLECAAEALLLSALDPDDRALPAGVLPEQDAHDKGSEAGRASASWQTAAAGADGTERKSAPLGEGLHGERLIEQLLHLAEKTPSDCRMTFRCRAPRSEAVRTGSCCRIRQCRSVLRNCSLALFHGSYNTRFCMSGLNWIYQWVSYDYSIPLRGYRNEYRLPFSAQKKKRGQIRLPAAVCR